ncbi:TlpA family protein disulfide reductase [Flavobacterium sp. NG2]|uniref:TlpA family protein disulfide reductase n=1 Tax=Flavobacterium sp. NG2 TaxID=3097547 RepID=UPI002A807ABF|nr:TlpA family protein disulfide reductase [Flavobacterium sp. NG2]WPR70933.1 TlpA family protein disulfide reductase [Flavobacterium sp. NG2]
MRWFLIMLFSLFFSNAILAQKPVVYDSYSVLEEAILNDKNTTYVVNFWATWCAPCVKELPYFEKLNLENKAVKVVLVSLDFKDQYESRLIPFLKKKAIQSQVVLLTDKNYNHWLPKVDKDWSGSIPATLIVKGNKRIFAERDFASYEELNNYINTNSN